MSTSLRFESISPCSDTFCCRNEDLASVGPMHEPRMLTPDWRIESKEAVEHFAGLKAIGQSKGLARSSTFWSMFGSLLSMKMSSKYAITRASVPRALISRSR